MTARILAFLSAIFLVSPAARPATPVVYITGATVIHPDRTGADAVQSNTSIVIRGDRIEAVLQNVTFELPQGATVINAYGKYVVPGLVDSHVHFFQSGNPYTRPDAADFNAVVPYAQEVARNKARLDKTFSVWIANGVTGVVDIGGPMWNFTVRDRAPAVAAAPRVAIAGPLLSMIDDPPLDLGDPPIVRVDSVESGLALVRKELEQKPDYIKVWFIHQEGDDLAKQEAIVKAAGDAAHAAGARLAVHATELDVAKAALRAGADFLVHSVFDVPVDDEFIALARARHVLYCPTLYVWQSYEEVLSGLWRATPEEQKSADPEVLAAMDDIASIPPDKIPARVKKFLADPKQPTPPKVAMDNLKRLRDAGITIVMGTDAGNIGVLHGPSIYREMRMMVDSGMTPLEVLRSASTDGANALGLADERGRIAAGQLADLVVLDADPLADIGNLARVHRVLKGGVVFEPEALLKALK